MDIGGDRLRLRDEVRREPSLLPLLAARIVSLQGTAHASEQFVRRDRFYEIANHVGFGCLRLRPLVRIAGHENGLWPVQTRPPRSRPTRADPSLFPGSTHHHRRSQPAAPWAL